MKKVAVLSFRSEQFRSKHQETHNDGESPHHNILNLSIKVINYEVLTWCYQRGPMRNAENGARGCKIFGDLLAELICMAPTCSEHMFDMFDDFYWFLMRGSDRQPAEADPTELFHRRRARAHRRVAALQWSGHGCGPPPPRREILAFQAMLALKSQSIAFIRFLSCHCRDVGQKMNCPPFIPIHTKPSWQFGCIVVSYFSVLQFRSLHSQPAVFECSHGSLPKILSLICLIGSAFPASFSLPLHALALFLKVSSKTSCGTTSKTTLTDPCRYRAKRCFCISSLALADSCRKLHRHILTWTRSVCTKIMKEPEEKPIMSDCCPALKLYTVAMGAPHLPLPSAVVVHKLSPYARRSTLNSCGEVMASLHKAPYRYTQPQRPFHQLGRIAARRGGSRWGIGFLFLLRWYLQGNSNFYVITKADVDSFS